MRPELRFVLHSPLFLIVVLLLLLQGCARPALQMYPADEEETEKVLEAFSYLKELNRETCGCCIDAEVDATLSVSGWFRDHSGKISGYLQLLKPGYIRFTALNPLGLPWYILVTDGETFKSLNVFEEKAYLGSVRSETFQKFTPEGFEPQFSFYWLTGRFLPKDMQIRAVMRHSRQNGYWLQIDYPDTRTESMILFNPEELLILRHVLRDRHGEHLADVDYKDYKFLSEKQQNSDGFNSREKMGFCRVPGAISVTSQGGAKKLEFNLHSFIAEPHFSAEDFSLDIPDNFTQLLVK